MAAVQPSAELNDTSSDEPSYTSHNDEPTVTLIDEPDDTSSEKVSKKKPKKKPSKRQKLNKAKASKSKSKAGKKSKKK